MQEGQYKSVIIAGVAEGAGGTTVASRVAAHLRQSFGAKPLVVDLDFRHSPEPSLNSGPPAGLEAIARGAASACESVETNDAGVSVIVAGSDPTLAGRGVAEVLRRVVEESSACFDFIVVDAPAVLESAAVVEAGSVVPRLLLVAEAGRTSREAVQRARRRLETAGVEIIGCILNKEKRYMPAWLYRWLAG